MISYVRGNSQQLWQVYFTTNLDHKFQVCGDKCVDALISFQEEQYGKILTNPETYAKKRNWINKEEHNQKLKNM